MRKVFNFLFACLLVSPSFAQEKPISVDVLGQTVPSNNYYTIVATLDNYWDNYPLKDQKGSGFKPYARWKEYWKYYLNADSTLMTSDQILAQYHASKKAKPNKFAKTTGTDLSFWEPLGPFTHTNKGSLSPGQGRVNVTTVDPSNPNTIYVGSANGGVWRSGDHGNTWTALTDFFPSIGVSGIAIDPSDAKVIYVSTGDEDGNNAYTDGIYKSIDSGVTWTQLSYPYLPMSSSGEIYVNPFNTNMVWVVGRTGLYKSIDAGATWVQKTTERATEIRQMPNDSATIYVVEQIGYTTNILKSTDAGETFATIQTYTFARRAVIDVSPADPNYLYVLVANGDNTYKGIYRTTDAGLSFTTQDNSTNIFGTSTQAYFDLAIAVSDTDPNTIYTGCLDIWKSTDGGVNINTYNWWLGATYPNYTHGDIHDIKFINKNIYVSSDGGIYVSEDDGLSFSDKTINGVNISQFYRIDVAQSDSTIMAGGLQDNGGYSYANNNWIVYHGGDGMDAAIDPTSIYDHYGFVQYGGKLYKLNASTGLENGKFLVNKPKFETGSWITPLEFGNGGKLYAGYSRLYYLGDTSLVLAAPTYFSTLIKQIRVHPSNDEIVLVSNGLKLYISDGTPAFGFTEFTTLPLKSITNFDFNRNNPNIIYAIGDSGVFKSTNSGSTWEDITYSLPKGSKNSIIHQAGSFNNTVYLAMNKAVYYIDDTMTDWQLYSNNIPNTTITDIEVNNVENYVVISTYGRGIWRSPVATTSLAIEEKLQQSNSVYLFPNPVIDKVSINTFISEPCTISVFDTRGATVLSKKYIGIDPNTQIDLSNLSTGVYFLQLHSEKHLITKKFIKE